MQLTRLLPFVLLITCALGVIRPQSYLDSIAGTDTIVRYPANDLSLRINSTTDTGSTGGIPNIRMGGNRDLGVQILPGSITTSANIVMRCYASELQCRGDTPTGILATYFYQLDGQVDQVIGTATTPSLGSVGSFDFSQAGESGLVVNVTSDHTITITFSVYTGSSQSDANRFSYALTIPHSTDNTLTSSYFIPYSAWLPSGTATIASFRTASAFAYIVTGEFELDWIMNLFAPYANIISGRVYNN